MLHNTTVCEDKEYPEWAKTHIMKPNYESESDSEYESSKSLNNYSITNINQNIDSPRYLNLVKYYSYLFIMFLNTIFKKTYYIYKMIRCCYKQEFLYVIRTHKDINLPTKGSLEAAGFDIESAEDIVIKAKEIKKINTGLIIKPPKGSYLQIYIRSSLALKGLVVLGGVIDRDYRGIIYVVIKNYSDEDFIIKKHDRISQIVPINISEPALIEVKVLDKTNRGKNGFGSTGK